MLTIYADNARGQKVDSYGEINSFNGMDVAWNASTSVKKGNPDQLHRQMAVIELIFSLDSLKVGLDVAFSDKNLIDEST